MQGVAPKQKQVWQPWAVDTVQRVSVNHLHAGGPSVMPLEHFLIAALAFKIRWLFPIHMDREDILGKSPKQKKKLRYLTRLSCYGSLLKAS